MKFVIEQKGIKRELEGPFYLYGDVGDLRQLQFLIREAMAGKSGEVRIMIYEESRVWTASPLEGAYGWDEDRTPPSCSTVCIEKTLQKARKSIAEWGEE